MKTLIIDNYDSFTYNLYQQIASLSGCRPLVVKNDTVSLSQIKELDVDAIVISPGPGRPDRPADFGVCGQVFAELELPVLGVCLGFQGLACCFGASLGPAAEPLHGRGSRIFHVGNDLFEGIPQGFSAIRYHSLAVDDALPSCLTPLAHSEDGVLMGIKHKRYPFWGIQFHPESICSEWGDQIVENFLKLSGAARSPASFPMKSAAKPVAAENSSPLRLCHRKLPFYRDPEASFMAIYGDRDHAYWLDSSMASQGLSRFSFMGDATGPHSLVLSYRSSDKQLRFQGPGQSGQRRESVFQFMETWLQDRAQPNPDLPFEFNGGFVGYFGYELKAECGTDAVHSSPYPDAAHIFSDRFLAFDHQQEVVYLVALEAESGESAVWLEETEARLAGLAPAQAPKVVGHQPEFRLARSEQDYLEDILTCLQKIREGESYEVCLTNRLHVTTKAPPLDLYRTLRRLDPAPYAAFLRFGDLTVLCSSPEQFLCIGEDRSVSSKPIKGTISRERDQHKDKQARTYLESNAKDRSENMMIVDLLRNDLGRVCREGSVHVPKLMEVESFATVHQLVSTVCGTLKEEETAISCLRAAFPGGSMIGAPKLRTMEIIDRLETEARGIYSGSIGYLGLNGSADLNIVIRTAVKSGDTLSIGVGGAIVALSDAQNEFDEIVLKAKGLIHAISSVSGNPSNKVAIKGCKVRRS